jgi:hypothetical protein
MYQAGDTDRITEVAYASVKFLEGDCVRVKGISHPPFDTKICLETQYLQLT